MNDDCMAIGCSCITIECMSLVLLGAYCKIVLFKLSKWHESGSTGLHTVVQCLDICVGHGHSLSGLYVARCRDGEVHIQCDLKLANVDLGC